MQNPMRTRKKSYLCASLVRTPDPAQRGASNWISLWQSMAQPPFAKSSAAGRPPGISRLQQKNHIIKWPSPQWLLHTSKWVYYIPVNGHILSLQHIAVRVYQIRLQQILYHIRSVAASFSNVGYVLAHQFQSASLGGGADKLRAVFDGKQI